MQNVVMIIVFKVPIASVIPVCWSPNVPLMKHVVMVNVFKEEVASVKLAN